MPESLVSIEEPESFTSRRNTKLALAIAVAQVKHLVGRHNQREHGRTTSRKFNTPDVHGVEKHKVKVIDAFLKSLKVSNQLVSTVWVQKQIDIDRYFAADPLNHHPKPSGIMGYRHSRVKGSGGDIVISSDLDKRRMLLACAHEVGHAMSEAYPSLFKTFVEHMKSKAPSEWNHMMSAAREAKYSSKLASEESFAQFYGIVMSNPSYYKRDFPEAVRFFTSETWTK